jgi:hypothetical protein
MEVKMAQNKNNRIKPVAIIYVKPEDETKGFIIIQIWDNMSVELAIDSSGTDTELVFNLETTKQIKKAIDNTIGILRERVSFDNALPVSVVFTDRLSKENGGFIFIQVLDKEKIQLIEAEDDRTITSLVFEIDTALKIRDALEIAIKTVNNN